MLHGAGRYPGARLFECPPPIGSRPLSASLADLVAMKRVAGRARDLEDVEALEAIARLRSEGDA